jgi:hypothetical protein
MLIEARNVTKAFGAFKAVDDASVSVEEGDILGLIGPNGAGKSTFFNCLTGDLPVTSGSVTFAGTDVTRLPPEARARLGLARSFQVPLTFDSMSVLDNATIGALLRHPNAREARARARAVLERVGLGPLADSPAKSLGTPGRKRSRSPCVPRSPGAARRGDGRPDDRGARGDQLGAASMATDHHRDRRAGGVIVSLARRSWCSTGPRDSAARHAECRIPVIEGTLSAAQGAHAEDTWLLGSRHLQVRFGIEGGERPWSAARARSWV